FIGASVGDTAEITIPVAAIPQVSPQSAGLLGPGNFWLHVLARPLQGLSPDEVRTRLALVWPRISEPLISSTWPAFQRKEMMNATFEVTSGGTGWTYLRDLYRKPLWVLMAMVALVVLICCANVASLLLAQASARQREIVVRYSLGGARR